MDRLLKALKNLPKNIAIILILFYRNCLSIHFPGCCRFRPTCSEYGLQAFQKYGFIKGAKLTAKRLIKCRPGGSYGYDPLP